jgi:hypothetical protein
VAGEMEVLEENLSQRRFVCDRSHLTCSGIEPNSRGWKPATNRRSHGAASLDVSKEFKRATRQ